MAQIVTLTGLSEGGAPFYGDFPVVFPLFGGIGQSPAFSADLWGNFQRQIRGGRALSSGVNLFQQSIQYGCDFFFVGI